MGGRRLERPRKSHGRMDNSLPAQGARRAGHLRLEALGYALQTRWLWLRKTDSSRAWSQLPLDVDPQVMAFFRCSTYTSLGNGTTALFWEDRWLQQQAPVDLAPNLARLVPRRIRDQLTVRQGLTGRRWTSDIAGSMSQAAIAEFFDLWEATANTQLGEREDCTVWRWMPDGEYSAKSAYKILHVGSIPFRGHSLIWRTWAPLEVKIFL